MKWQWELLERNTSFNRCLSTTGIVDRVEWIDCFFVRYELGIEGRERSLIWMLVVSQLPNIENLYYCERRRRRRWEMTIVDNINIEMHHHWDSISRVLLVCTMLIGFWSEDDISLSVERDSVHAMTGTYRLVAFVAHAHNRVVSKWPHFSSEPDDPSERDSRRNERCIRRSD